ncbi:hypothetical protein FTUN_0719 [Frigoriglobus tundricola]|uniref:Uncharacterized protein n=1 Tax=Frigoriglobus tundricola TaxID=2774151 RepID=A0A6M5YI51_9BACT|nr:hypothetical protein FTUN_0719 [Frigoriglobus tundricola]
MRPALLTVPSCPARVLARITCGVVTAAEWATTNRGSPRQFRIQQTTAHD